jgi:hypothetical protein
MSLVCPLCHKELYQLGDNSYVCGVFIVPQEQGSPTTHYYIIGAMSVAIIMPFRLQTWRVVEEDKGCSVLAEWDYKRLGWHQIVRCDEIPITDEKALRQRLKLLVLFS